jgi:hypothetical protein
MKPSEIYQHLKDIAMKVDIAVSEHNLRATGINARSGLCRVRGQTTIYHGQTSDPARKIDLLGESMAKLPLDEIYIVPSVRKFLDRFRNP